MRDAVIGGFDSSNHYRPTIMYAGTGKFQGTVYGGLLRSLTKGFDSPYCNGPKRVEQVRSIREGSYDQR